MQSILYSKALVFGVIVLFVGVSVFPVIGSLDDRTITSILPKSNPPFAWDEWSEIQKLLASDAATGDRFGVSVSLDGDTALIGAYWDDANGSNSGSAYVFTWNGSTWTQQQKFLASDTVEGDEFGVRVSLDGDTALIGAYLHDANGTDSGSAYVFTRTGSTWTQQQKLLASDGATNDYFGYSVSLDGDTALIGAFLDNDNGSYSGSAYVFTRTGSTWTQQQKLLASDAASGDHFGVSVSLDGDTALIGAELNDDSGIDSGSAYVFTRSEATWTQQQKLLASDAATGDNFGQSVSLDGDTALIGGFRNNDNGSYSGSAYVFTRTGSTWTQQQKLLASDAASGDHFGVSVSLDSNTALIGASYDDDSGSNSGSAYVFTRAGSTWTQQQKLLASDGAANDFFSTCVCLVGNTAFIGACQNDDNGSESGSVYVFKKATLNQYNKSGAVGYAKQWYEDRNLHYHYYTDADCANFVSQCLIAGGLSLWKGYDGEGGGVYGDSYGTIPFCDYLHLHLLNYQDVTHNYIVNSGVPPTYLEPGDVIIYGNLTSGDFWRHAVIVVNTSGDSVNVSGHTEDIYDKNWTRYFNIIDYDGKRLDYVNFYHFTTRDFTDVDYQQFNVLADVLNVRVGPSSSYQIIGQLQQGEKYERYHIYTDSEENIWYQFWYDDRNAWVASWLVEDTCENIEFKVDCDILNVYAGPSTLHDVGSLHYGMAFTVFEKRNDWYHFNYSSGDGWCEIAYVDVIRGAPYAPRVDGPTFGEIFEWYEYDICTDDPKGDDVYYYVEWGDGTVCEWIGPFSSGEVVRVPQRWTYYDIFSVRVKARNTDGYESPYSDPLKVVVLKRIIGPSMPPS